MRIITLLSVFLMPGLVQASFIVQCEIEATVTRFEGDMPVIRVNSIGKVRGHSDQCPVASGSEHVVTLDNRSGIRLGQRLQLHYDYYNGMGQDGIVEGDSWRRFDE